MKKIFLAGLYLFVIPIIFNLVLSIIGRRNLIQALKYGVVDGGLGLIIILGGLKLIDYLNERLNTK